MNASKIQSSSPRSQLRKLKQIEKVLSSPSLTLSNSYRHYERRWWRVIMRFVAMMDLLSFSYMRQVQYHRMKAYKESLAKKNKNIFRRIFNNIPEQTFLKRYPSYNQLHWIERYQFIVDYLFCICWLVEGFRVAFKIATSRITRTKMIWYCELVPIFITILLFYFLLLPLEFWEYIGLDIEVTDKEKAYYKFDPIHDSISIHTTIPSSLKKSSLSSSFHYKGLDKFSLPFVTFLHFYAIANLTLKAKLYILEKRLLKNAARFIFKNPFTSKRIISKCIIILKVIKSILPVYKSLHLLANRSKKLMKLRRQRRELYIQRQTFKRLWSKMSTSERLSKAVLIIQANFRKRQAMKQVQPMLIQKRHSKRNLMTKMKEDCTHSARVLANKIDSQTKLLKKMKERQEIDKKKIQMEEKLEAELKSSIFHMRRIMAIIRPNCTFCVLWNSAVFTCIFMETLPSLLPSLNVHYQEIIFQSISPYLHLHAFDILNTIYLLDAIIDFFTGRLNENGYLVPETITARWIPFIMKSISNPISATFTKEIIFLCFNVVGPTRMFRWTIIFILPFCNMMLSSLIWFWCNLVQFFNGVEFSYQ